MSERGVVWAIFQEAIRKKGTQAIVAEEARIDGAAISKFLSGEGSLKMDVIERVPSPKKCAPRPARQTCLSALRMARPGSW